MSFLFRRKYFLYVIMILVISMKNKRIVKKITTLLLFVVMIILFIHFGTKEYNIKVKDNVKFSNEYKDISKNNIFVYAKEHEILDILNGKSGIIFMGFSSNIWSHYYADYLNEVAIINEIDKIYYYDFKKDRQMNNQTYLNIVNKLQDYLYSTDTGSFDVSAPTIIVVKDGKIIYFDDEVSRIKGNISPEEYFTDYKKNLFFANIDNSLKEFKGE